MKKRRAVAEWHNEVKKLPELLANDGGDQHIVCQKLEKLRTTEENPRWPIWVFLSWFLAAALIFLPLYDLSTTMRLGILLATVPISGATSIYYQATRVVNNYNIILPVYKLLLFLERRRDDWAIYRSRVSIVRRIEKIAHRIDRIPANSGTSDPYVLAQLHEQANECSTSLRQLEAEVLMPKSDTHAHIKKELLERFLLLLDGRWYELPRIHIDTAQRLIEARRKQRRRRIRIAFSTISALLLFGAALVVVTELQDSTAALITPFLISTAVTVLGFGGIELKALSDSKDITQQVVKGSGESSQGS